MPRPPDPAVREGLLDAATELFYRDGIRATGVDAVWKRAGVAKMTLYHYFPTKDDLIAEVVRRRDRAWRAEFFAAVEKRAGGDPQKRVLAAFDLLVAGVREKGFRGCPFINAAVELADPAHPAHPAVVENKRATRAWFLASLKGSAIPRAPDLANELMLLFNGALVTCAIEGSDRPAQQARRSASRLLTSARL
jgi:AcrR family transcriptional regulator